MLLLGFLGVVVGFALGPPKRPAFLRHAVAPDAIREPAILLVPDGDEAEGERAGITVPEGTRCAVIGPAGGFTRIEYDGRTWFVRTNSVRYLEEQGGGE